MDKKFTIKKITGLAALTALSLITFMIESLFPPIFIPGSKMGLSNIFALLAVIIYGGLEGVILVLIKTTLGSIFIGNVSALLYSLPAGLITVTLEIVLIKFVSPKISIVAISVVSAIIHNITQNIVFALITSPLVLIYLPYLVLIGAVSGVIVGLATYYIIKLLPKTII